MSKPTRYYSNKQEQYVAKALGGHAVIGSGSPHHVAGDVIIPNTMVIECKTTTKEGCNCKWSNRNR